MGGSQGVQFDKQPLTITRDNGSSVTIDAEIAVSDEQRAQGLMHRRELADGAGMLFVFSQDQMLSFWMKNTLIPLSIAFIASDGRILEIHDMEPESTIPVKSTRSARYALEVPQGWFTRAEIIPGDTADLRNVPRGR
ncbi:DUF192 domain-containing protein [Breznakiella homolactica]|uniref:DUF192 domain-containing protein n=2 Tax=Breznakiella homolactica TaxID=2798577 RepID=A0A7T8BCQ2_9SPIR|nr:DUF192 domain-containing protein [Breznakiella homolactica]